LLQEMQGREDPCWIKEMAGRDAGVVVTTPLMASAIGAIQVETALRWVVQPGDSATGVSYRLTLHPGPSLESSRFDRSPTCPLHEPASVMRDVRELDLRSDVSSADTVLHAAGADFGVLRFDWPVTAEASCRACSLVWEPFLRRAAFRTSVCPACGSSDIVEQKVVTSIGPGSPWGSRSLVALGQPVAHIFEIVISHDDELRTVHVEMTGDLPGGGRNAAKPC
jgi:hypothetical protein